MLAAKSRNAECHCLAVRQAARHVTQFYDRFLAPFELRATQFSILSRLRRNGPLTINALAAAMVMDRTTLGRNVQPLQRDGLVVAVTGKTDRRSRELQLTPAGIDRIDRALKGWRAAQEAFEDAFGKGRAAELRTLLHSVAASDLAGPA